MSTCHVNYNSYDNYDDYKTKHSTQRYCKDMFVVVVISIVGVAILKLHSTGLQ